MTTAPSWSTPRADFFLSATPQQRRLFTPFSPQAQWFLPQLDPERLLPRIGPALHLERADAVTMVHLLQGHGFCLQVWTPRLTLSTTPKHKPFTPWVKPPPEPRLQWPYEWERLSGRQLRVMHSLLELKPNHQLVTIPLDSP